MHSVVSVKQNPPVVVGIDGSRRHLATVDLAAREAVRRNAPLLIVHVWPGRYSGSFRTRDPVPTEADGWHLLEVAARHAGHRAIGVEVCTDLDSGSAANVLVRHSQRAQLLVVGHRDAMYTRPGWGSTAAYLAQHGACPLLVSRGGVPERGPVVVAASAREAATATLVCAYEEAALSGNRLVAVHVWGEPSEQDAPPPITVASEYIADRQAAERHLVEALAGSAWTFPDVTVERLVQHDHDIEFTLDRASRRGRLLVAGMSRNGRFVELLYGSVGRALMSKAVCPVLLVPNNWRHPATGSAIENAVAADPSRPPAMARWSR